MSLIKGINHVTFSVSSLERSFLFYSKVLDFKPKLRWSKGAYFLAGSLWVCIIEEENRLIQPRSDYTHMAFSVSDKSFVEITKRLGELKIPQWQENTSEGASFYFLDPDNHKLEIHVGSLQSRLEEAKKDPWDEEMVFF
ncbi:MAG: VOC family protein [Bacteriovoracia bacterium]